MESQLTYIGNNNPYDFVNWDDDIPNIWKINMFQTHQPWWSLVPYGGKLFQHLSEADFASET